MRKILRNMAKVNMKKKGMRQICKKNKNRESWFSKNWRDYVPKNRKVRRA